MMVIFLNFFVAIFPVIAIMTDETDPHVMRAKPRDPTVPIFNRSTGPRWIAYGLVLGIVSMIPLVWGPDEPSIDHASVAMTMAFCVMGIGTVLSGFVMRHDKAPAFTQPLLKFGGLLGAGALFVVFATQFQFLQRWLQTTTLTTNQWGAVLGLALVMPLIVEADKLVQRLRTRQTGTRGGPRSPAGLPDAESGSR
jgi:Ca2+-transporting ATPase